MTRNLRKLVVGLGNHSHLTTRHSIGMVVLNDLASAFGISWLHDRECAGLIANYKTDQHDIIFLKPRMPMNINGKSILKTARKFDVDQSNICLIHDDLEIPVGKIRIKLEGSARGHNGVKSTISCLKSDKIKRLRIGIDRPSNKDEIVEYVLSNFNPEELQIIDYVRQQCLKLITQELEIPMDRSSLISSNDFQATIDGG